MTSGFEKNVPAEAAPSPLRSQTPATGSFPVWTGWDVLAMVGFFCLALFCLTLVAQGTWRLLSVLVDDLSVFSGPGYSGMAQILIANLLNGLILFFIYRTITVKYRSPFWSSIKWSHSASVRPGRYLCLGALLAVVMGALSSLIPGVEDLPISELLRHAETAILLGVTAILVAPFVEEVVFRGFIYPVLERQWGAITAVILTALLFASLHVTQLWGSWMAVSVILFVGLILSLVRAATDSLFPSFLLHLSYNVTLCLLSLMGLVLEGLWEGR